MNQILKIETKLSFQTFIIFNTLNFSLKPE
jgi:hypothetical protein